MQLSSVFAGVVIALTATVYAAPIEADSAKRDVGTAHDPGTGYHIADERALSYRELEARDVETAHDPGTGYHIADERAPSYEELGKRDFETAHDPGTGYHIADKRAPSY